MLSLYKRHLKKCPLVKPDDWKCRCPYWVMGTVGGVFIRESLKTSNRQVADEEIARREREQTPSGAPLPITVEKAITDWFADIAHASGRNLKPPTIEKYRLLLDKRLLPFCREKGIIQLRQLDLPTLREFRQTWTDGAVAGTKKLERLRAFFSFAERSGWVVNNPAKGLDRPKIDQAPTGYFTPSEMSQILTAIDLYKGDRWGKDTTRRARLKALTLLMRWTGLAIRDAVTLERSRVCDGRLFLYRAKTGNPVQVPLHEEVITALAACPSVCERYFFWTGNGHAKTVVADWQRTYRKLFRLAKLKNRAHPHMFRDTFAVEMLLAGVPLEEVSILLGHKSVKVTEKHYLPWVQARQEKLEESVRKAWAAKPTTGDVPAQPQKRECGE